MRLKKTTKSHLNCLKQGNMELEKFKSESSLGHFIQKFDNFMKNIRIKLKNNKNIFTKYMKCTKGYAR